MTFREKFVDIVFGKPTFMLNSADEHKPYSVFQKVAQLDKLVKNVLLPQTALYAAQKGDKIVVTEEEMRVFLGINIFMGYHRLPAMRDYWKTDRDLHVPVVASTMPRRRFEKIRKYLHFSNNAIQPSRNSRKFDRAFKVRPLFCHFNAAFTEAYSFEEIVSVDEHMVKFQGMNSMKQYMKGKPIPWGFKEWLLAAAKSGYVYIMDIYTGKGSSSTMGIGESVVLHLTQSLSGTNCVVGMDNYFTSLPLLRQLHAKSIRAIGTIRPNRKGLPSGAKECRKMKEDEIRAYVSADGKLSVCAWRDMRPVIVASNYTDPFVTTEVK
jgi:hypothetical protein